MMEPTQDSSEEFRQLLAIRHYVPIGFPLSAGELQQAAGTFLDFLAMPDSVKRQLHFPARSYRASADGYTDKSGVDNKDPKQFFHWNPKLEQKADYQRLQTAYPEIARFFQWAKKLYLEIEKVLHRLFVQYLPEHLALIFDGNTLIDGTLRFLCYSPRPNHEFGARAHYDKGFSTLAVADSTPGLRIGCCDSHPLKSVQYESGVALFMPAWMLFKASRGEIKPAWHDVIQSPGEQNVNAFCARWSIVFFVNHPDTPFSSWDTVHTPLH